MIVEIFIYTDEEDSIDSKSKKIIHAIKVDTVINFRGVKMVEKS